jgi:hypothetical protein
MTAQDASPTHRCRYRLVTGCTATFGTQPGRIAHEKKAHADILVALLDCPECPERLADEAGRGMHMANAHGLAASSERRQELDALQVQKILAASTVPAVVPPVVASPFATAPQAPVMPSPNGHSAPPPAPYGAVRDQLAALIAEVKALREENAALKADSAALAEIRAMLAAG